MNVKIDTKEKFHVIRLPQGPLTANMSVELAEIIRNCRIPDNANVIIDMSAVTVLDPQVAMDLLAEQEKAYNMQHSFVVCCLDKAIEKQLDELDILDQMNLTRTESEAWDIVQMEEIERELLN
jgi:anti-anti-sigma regulatory factor